MTVKWSLIDHNEKDVSMYNLTERTAGIKQKRLRKDADKNTEKHKTLTKTKKIASSVMLFLKQTLILKPFPSAMHSGKMHIRHLFR